MKTRYLTLSIQNERGEPLVSRALTIHTDFKAGLFEAVDAENPGHVLGAHELEIMAILDLLRIKLLRRDYEQGDE